MAGRILGAKPPAPGPKQEVIRVTSTEPRTFVIVSTAIWGQWIHWYGSRSHECVSDKKECNGCVRGWPRKWKGYLHVVERAGGPGNFLEITPMFEDIISMQVPRDQSLRGCIMRVSKTKGGAKGRYIIDVLERRHDLSVLPEERDPVAILKFLWQCKNVSSQNETATL
jgi:hypothetical protein